jgi:rhamnose utilization protein RhaD (predicted bifunctional aldolase and dehydrogenase)
LNFPSEQQLVDLCMTVAQDPLLVQGAGGNLSAKEGESLWIKASGTWLSEAADKEIFIPLNRIEVETMVSTKNFEKLPSATNGSQMRPSIETWLHALMPQKFVLHLHALDVLALLVRVDSEIQIKSYGEKSRKWGFVKYVKPGPSLALEVSKVVRDKPAVEVLMLENHGIVMAADSVEKIIDILREIRTIANQPVVTATETKEIPSQKIAEYEAVRDREVHCLATSPALLALVRRAWAIAPDHVVFLGPKPSIFESVSALADYLDKSANDLKPLVAFIEGVGVFSKGPLDLAGEHQLKAYFELLVRQQTDTFIKCFSDSEIAELLNWDAEQYRQSMRK